MEPHIHIMPRVTGIIPAAGRGSRLGGVEKSLLEVRGRPLIHHAMDSIFFIVDGYIIIHNGEIPDVIGPVFKGKPVEYVRQEELKGIADAILRAEKKVQTGAVAVVLGDVYYDGKDIEYMKGALLEPKIPHEYDALVGMALAKSPQEIMGSYGVDKEGRFVEKPTLEEVKGLKKLVGLGLYLAKSLPFFAALKKTPAGKNGEIQITDTLNYMRTGEFFLHGEYVNVNTPEDLEKLK